MKEKTGSPSPANLSPRQRISFLFKDSVVYGSALAISRAFSLITFPLIARNLSVADYGTLDLFLVFSGLLMTLIILGQDSAVGRYFYEYENTEQRRQIISQSLLIQFAASVLIVGALLLAYDTFAKLLSSNEAADQYFLIILLQVPFMAAINFSQNILKWTFSRKSFLLVSIGYAFCQAGTISIMAFVSDLSTELILLITLVNNIVFGSLGIYLVRKWLVVPRHMHHLRELMRFALPIGLICLLGAAVPMLERQFVEKLIGSQELGIYAAGSKLSMLLALVVGSFQTAWGPFSTSIYREADASTTYNLVLKIFLFLVCILAMLLDAFAEPLLHLLATNRFTDAKIVVFPIAMAIAIQAISWITEIGIGLSKRTTLIIYPYLAYLLVLASAMIFLIPELGIFGAALSMLLAQVARSVVASWLAQWVYPMNWNYLLIVTVISFTLIVGLVLGRGIDQWGEWHEKLLFYIVAIAIMCIYFWVKVMQKSDREYLMSCFRRVF